MFVVAIPLVLLMLGLVVLAPLLAIVIVVSSLITNSLMKSVMAII